MFTDLAVTVAEKSNAYETIKESFDFGGWYFVAQVINFFIVIWVLRKFAFGPIQAMLEQRRQRIADGETKLQQIEQQLAASAQTTAAAIAKANEDAVRLINEAKQGATAFTEQKAQEAIAQAQKILAQAAITAQADRDRLSLELKREFGRLVVATTAQVTGKVLTADDQQRINQDALSQVEG